MHHPIPLFAVVDGMTLATVRTYTSRAEAEAVADAMNTGVGGLYRVVETPAVPAQPEAATAAGKKQWQVGRQTVIQDDCLAGLASLPEKSIDAVVTSPPYNIGIAYKSYEDRRPRPEYLAWLAEIGAELSRVMTDSGSFFLNVGSTGADPWIAMDVANAFREAFVLQNHIVWVKSVSVGSDTVGHFKPITSRRFLNNNHEAIFHFTKSGHVEIDRLAVGVPYKDKSNIGRWQHAKADVRCAGNTWFIPYQTVRSKAQKFDHPAGFPVALPERCLRLHGVDDAVVLDPFLGAGTTLVAAERLGMSGVGFEMDADYAAAAVARLNAEIACRTTVHTSTSARLDTLTKSGAS